VVVPAAWDAALDADVRLGPEVVLIPVKAFHQAKRRLGTALSDPDRVQLVRTMATHVISASAPLPVVVVCDDEVVAAWAEERGASVVWAPGQGLNGAVRVGVDRLAQAGAHWVTVAHGDLPRAKGLGTLSPFDGVTLVPDRRDDGTNVLRLPATADFRFAYGPGSFRAHRAEATRLGLAVRILRSPDLAYDVDWPADFTELSTEP
jgi:2-phospho-L-lactate/phosphoenolpyruvate guanylyltransferase